MQRARYQKLPEHLSVDEEGLVPWKCSPRWNTSGESGTMPARYLRLRMVEPNRGGRRLWCRGIGKGVLSRSSSPKGRGDSKASMIGSGNDSCVMFYPPTGFETGSIPPTLTFRLVNGVPAGRPADAYCGFPAHHKRENRSCDG